MRDNVPSEVLDIHAQSVTESRLVASVMLPSGC